MKEERKYFIKGGWIFNLEAMHDKPYFCIFFSVKKAHLF